MPRSILTLPPEIRNKIYTHYFCKPPSQCRSLTLVNTQLHCETNPLFYQQLTFSLASPRKTKLFLHTLRPSLYASVTTLALSYSTYGAPGLAADVVWQEKHIAAWTEGCKALAKQLTSLRNLRIRIYLSDGAPKFNLHQAWLVPLLQFRRLRSFRAVEVEVRSCLYRSDFSRNSGLAVACRKLHRLFGDAIAKALMGEKEEEAMAVFNKVWQGELGIWRHHLAFALTGW